MRSYDIVLKFYISFLVFTEKITKQKFVSQRVKICRKKEEDKIQDANDNGWVTRHRDEKYFRTLF